jgi:hypothetical protein
MIVCRSQLLLCLVGAVVCCGCPSYEDIPPEPPDSESQVEWNEADGDTFEGYAKVKSDRRPG